MDFRYRFGTGIYLRQTASARCFPFPPIMNPVTAKWITETGWERAGWTLAVGHQSEHGVSTAQNERKTESFNYLRVSFELRR